MNLAQARVTLLFFSLREFHCELSVTVKIISLTGLWCWHVDHVSARLSSPCKSPQNRSSEFFWGFYKDGLWSQTMNAILWPAPVYAPSASAPFVVSPRQISCWGFTLCLQPMILLLRVRALLRCYLNSLFVAATAGLPQTKYVGVDWLQQQIVDRNTAVKLSGELILRIFGWILGWIFVWIFGWIFGWFFFTQKFIRTAVHHMTTQLVDEKDSGNSCGITWNM